MKALVFILLAVFYQVAFADLPNLRCQVHYKKWISTFSKNLEDFYNYDIAPSDKKQIQQAAEEYWQQIATKDRKWIKLYTEIDAYKLMNQLIRRIARDGKPFPQPKENSNYNESMVRMVEALDRVTAQFILPEGLILFRGLGLKKIPRKGSIFTEQSFASTSLEFYTAKDYAESNARGNKQVVFIIETGSKTHGFVPKKKRYTNEYEILLPRATQYRIGEKFHKHGITYIRVSVFE